MMISVVGLAVSLQSLRFGRHLAHTLPGAIVPSQSLHGLCERLGETDFLLCLLVPVTLLIWVLVAIDFSSQSAESMEMQTAVPTTAAAVAFAPLGAVLRYRLSALNGRVPHFPVGTWLANMTGSVVATLIALQLASGAPTILCV